MEVEDCSGQSNNLPLRRQDAQRHESKEYWKEKDRVHRLLWRCVMKVVGVVHVVSKGLILLVEAIWKLGGKVGSRYSPRISSSTGK